MMNAFTSSWLELDLVVYMGVYLPLMLWAIDKRRWPELAVLGALCLHAGHLQMAFYFGLVVIFHACLTVGLERKWRLVPGFLLSGVGVVLLAAPTVAPFLELMKQCQRPEFDFAGLQRFCTSLGGMLLSLLNPDFPGNPSRGFALNRSQSNFPFYEYAVYIGLIPLALVVLAVVRAPAAACVETASSKGGGRGALELRLWGAFAVVSLLFATATPLYRLVLLVLPFMNKALPGRFILVFVFAGCLLAAHGFEVWCGDERARRGVARALLLVSAPTALFQVGLAGWLWGRPEAARAWLQAHRDGRLVKVPAYDEGPAYLEQLVSGLQSNYLFNPNLAMTVLAGLLAWWMVRRPRPGLLAGFVALDLLLFAQHFNTTVPASTLLPTTPAITYLREQTGQFRVEKENAAFYNLLYPYGLSLVTGYESLFPNRYAETMRRAQPDGQITTRSVAFTAFDSPILSAMNLVYLLQAPLPLPAPPGWEKVLDERDGRVFRNPKALPRVFVRGMVKPFRTFEQALSYLGSKQFDPARELVMEELPPGPLSLDADGARAEIRLHEPDRVAVEAELPGPGVLVLADTIYPGWVCRDASGRERPIFPVNGTSRGVYLEAGVHQLEFLFAPRPYRLGLRLAAFGLLGAFLAAFARTRARGKGSR